MRNIEHIDLVIGAFLFDLEGSRHIEYGSSMLYSYHASCRKASTITDGIYFINDGSFDITG